MFDDNDPFSIVVKLLLGTGAAGTAVIAALGIARKMWRFDQKAQVDTTQGNATTINQGTYITQLRQDIATLQSRLDTANENVFNAIEREKNSVAATLTREREIMMREREQDQQIANLIDENEQLREENQLLHSRLAEVAIISSPPAIPAPVMPMDTTQNAETK